MIDGRTNLYGVIGNPIRHSLSPVLHNGAFRRMGLNAVYLAFEVQNLREAVAGIRGLGIRGVSVTIPFKTEIISLLDEIDEWAKEIHAINTILNREGRLIGYNTDWSGAIEALEKRVRLEGKRVLLLGAGGAARAIGYGLKKRNAEILICNRSLERGKALAEELGCRCEPLPAIKDFEAELLINATSVGMHPHDRESPVPKGLLRQGMTVMDIVYRPLRTRLLREAQECGCEIVDGLEMLAYQGAKQLELWTGRKPDVGLIRDDLLRAGGEGAYDRD